MSTTIRLTRMGRKKRPFYRLVVTDSRNRRDGAYIANLGYYNPFVEPYEVNLHDQEIISWLNKGAVASSTARSLIKNEGVLLRRELLKQGLDAAEVDSRVAAWKSDSANRADAKAKAKADAERKAKEEELKAKAEAERKAKEEEERKAKEEAAAAEAEAAAEETPATEGEAEKPAEDGGES